MNQTELAQALTEANDELKAVADQIDKGQSEVIGKIKDLEDAIAAGGTTTPEVEAALAALKVSADGLKVRAQTLDDVVPDVAPTDTATDATGTDTLTP